MNDASHATHIILLVMLWLPPVKGTVLALDIKRAKNRGTGSDDYLSVINED